MTFLSIDVILGFEITINRSHRKEAITMTKNRKTNNDNLTARGMVILPSICMQYISHFVRNIIVINNRLILPISK